MTKVGQLLYLHFEVIPKRIDIVDLGSSYALAHELTKEAGCCKSLWVPFLVGNMDDNLEELKLEILNC